MLFNSLEFLLFFPAVCLCYFVVPYRARYLFLLAFSYFFYMCWNPAYIVLILLSTGITYLCGRILGGMREKGGKDASSAGRRMKMVIAAGFALNIGLLVYFKYTNFLIDSVNFVLERFSVRPVDRMDILLPVGISFGGKQIYIANQKDGFAIAKYKKLRKEFMKIMNLTKEQRIKPDNSHKKIKRG